MKRIKFRRDSRKSYLCLFINLFFHFQSQRLYHIDRSAMQATLNFEGHMAAKHALPASNLVPSRGE